jgi:hypothetical protein
MSLRTCELAVFVAATRNQGLTWEQIRLEWNTTFEPLAYDDTGKFARDARTAYKRVTGQEWPTDADDADDDTETPTTVGHDLH